MRRAAAGRVPPLRLLNCVFHTALAEDGAARADRYATGCKKRRQEPVPTDGNEGLAPLFARIPVVATTALPLRAAGTRDVTRL